MKQSLAHARASMDLIVQRIGEEMPIGLEFMNKVEEKFAHKGIEQPGGWFIYSKKDAIEFVKECEKEAIEIIGIDAFYIRGENSVQPSLENSIDFSSGKFKASKDLYSDARVFLSDKDDGLFFEVICAL